MNVFKHLSKNAIALAIGFIVFYTYSNAGSTTGQEGSSSSFLFASILGGLSFVASLIILYMDKLFSKISSESFVGLLIGLGGALLCISVLNEIYFFTQALPNYIRSLINVLIVLSFSLIGFRCLKLNAFRNSGMIQENHDYSKTQKKNSQVSPKLLDTSIIIDGRILDILGTNFIEGSLVIPAFILREIQFISDSPDPIKRARGRRGLNMLNKLQERKDIDLEISYLDYSDIREADDKLVRAAKELNGKLVTNDFNLSKVAELQGVAVLNLNNLSSALKTIVLSGEEMDVEIIREGKDDDQGVGYMDDGTMVIVENAKELVGKLARVIVVSVLQTVAGKMIFTKVQDVLGDIEDKTKELPQNQAQDRERQEQSSMNSNKGYKSYRHKSYSRGRKR